MLFQQTKLYVYIFLRSRQQSNVIVSRILDISVKDNAKKVVDNTIGWV